MSTNHTKPKPRPRSIEDWGRIRKERFRNGGKSGGFRILPRQVIDSDAFNELSMSARFVLILSLDQLDYWQKKHHKGQSYRNSSVGKLRNDGRFSLPSNLIMERGIRSSSTISKLRKELVDAGFWETVQSGHLQQSGVFRWSDEWLKPEDQRHQSSNSVLPPGYCHYNNIVQFNQSRGSRSGTSQCSDTVSDRYSAAVQPEDEPEQLELFAGYAEAAVEEQRYRYKTNTA